MKRREITFGSAELLGNNKTLPFSKDNPSRHVFLRREAGMAARKRLKLDRADYFGPDIQINIPEDAIFSITSSFFQGMFSTSIRRAGSREKFLQRYQFNCSDHDFNLYVTNGIDRALYEGPLDQPGSVARMWNMLKHFF